MKERIMKLLNIKIEAIKKNIENLNYLNEELSTNRNNLKYLEETINTFDDDILNLDKIETEDFENILSLVDFSVREIFADKTCNYQGIMYIIKGIREGISLELTKEQQIAIEKLISALKSKYNEVKETIESLEESKEKLPETDLDILEANLEKYQIIIQKLKSNDYLVEIEELIDTLEFSNIPIEERVQIFSYILKYNRDIYDSIQPEEKPNEVFDNFDEVKISEIQPKKNDFFEQKDFELPKFDIKSTDNDINKEEDNYNLQEIIDKIDSKLKDYNEENNIENEPFFKEENDDLHTIASSVLKLSEDDIEKEMDLEFKSVKPVIQSENLSNNESSDNDIKTEVISLDKQEVSSVSNINDTIPNTPISFDDKLINIPTTNFNIANETLSPDTNTIPVIDNVNDENKKVLESYGVLALFMSEDNLYKQALTLKTSNLEKSFEIIKNELSLKESTFLPIVKVIIETLPIIFSNDTLLETFINNIDFYKKHNLNLINLFDNYRELLIVNTNVLEKNYQMISNYQISLNDDNVKYLLCNKNILENLDYYLEAFASEKTFFGKEQIFDGLEYITKYPYKLNNINAKVLQKLRYSTENNLKIFSSKPGVLAGEITNYKVDILELPQDYIDSYFKNEYEFIDRSELENLLKEIKNNQEFDLTVDDLIQKMDDNYKISEQRYKINNLYFSRIKTIRIYNYLKTKNILGIKALLIALTYQSVIKKEEYKNVESLITKLEEGGN